MEHLQGKLLIDLGGQKRVLYFDNLFLALACEDFGDEATFSEEIFKTPSKTVASLIYYAMRSGEDENEIPADFSVKTVLKWLRDVPQEKQQQIVKLFNHSMGFIIKTITGGMEPAAEAAKGGKN